LTATGAIISVLNTIKQENKDIEIPCFFGGDSATFVNPQILLKKVIAILENYSLHIKKM
jgi:PleD family two-component response regulator